MIVGCSGEHDESSSVRPEGFKVDVLLPTTPVRNQGKTEFCWVYAALAAIETDRLAQGDSVSLSPLWLEYHYRHSPLNPKHSQRGILPMAMRMIDDKGLVTDDAYHDTIFDLPRQVFLYGGEYTPKEFAHSCCLPGEWQTFTSFSDHPYGKTFVPDLKDNYWQQEAMNLPMDSLLGMTVSSLHKRHPVAWEGSMKSHLLSNRLWSFRLHRLTDDHCMCIIGMGHDNEGDRYFILKNSWGTKDGDHGFRYMSFDRFKLSTILIMMKIS